MEISKKSFKKGLMFGILVGLAWGLDTVLMGKIGGFEIFLNSKATPLVQAFFHDGFCFIWLGLLLLFKKDLTKAFQLMKTKKGKVTMIAALVGAPVGMSGYLMGVKYASAPYASSISVIYPGVGAVMSYFILKEKLSLRAVIGIAISILGSAALGYSKVDLDVYPHFYKGIAFALLAVLGWASEGVIIGYAMKKIQTDKEDDVEAKPIHFLTIRYLVSFLAYGLVVLPIVKGYGLAGEVIRTGTILYLAGIATLGAVTYLSWYKAVDLIGAAMGTALNSTAAFWAVIFSGLMGTKITPYLAFWCFVIVLGVMIFAVDPKEVFGSNRKKA
ncbi:DMT family transporter [Crassaminicella thermophila]|uniref:DMT family transporter n=1 Tax=Crassaminicella thermophila TaxID=2599308 RepID=A0A5C0SDC8_CRATE|nr:DMT family transporter [Crassaminicella thermophila]QEK11234.1 DMT family transporter [Crassaminicella thermophila]